MNAKELSTKQLLMLLGGLQSGQKGALRNFTDKALSESVEHFKQLLSGDYNGLFLRRDHVAALAELMARELERRTAAK